MSICCILQPHFLSSGVGPKLSRAQAVSLLVRRRNSDQTEHRSVCKNNKSAMKPFPSSLKWEEAKGREEGFMFYFFLFIYSFFLTNQNKMKINIRIENKLACCLLWE